MLQTSKAVDSVSTDRRCQFELPAAVTGDCTIEGVLACKVAAADGKVGDDTQCSLFRLRVKQDSFS